MRGARRDPWRLLQQQIVACNRCPRLRAYCREIAATKRRAYRSEEYWGKPVPGFGDHTARMLLVGLAPGAHGSNRTGRMFTGDASGDFLYAALWRLGLANMPESRSRQDGLALTGVWISAVARCAPPGNKPASEELEACRGYLAREIDLLDRLEVIVAFGGIAWSGMGRLLAEHARPDTQPRFGHGVVWAPRADLPPVFGCYHPSRQNTQTGRLTSRMFDEVLQAAWASAPGGPVEPSKKVTGGHIVKPFEM
jgi:uracil-DNA glycosylase family 4